MKLLAAATVLLEAKQQHPCKVRGHFLCTHPVRHQSKVNYLPFPSTPSKAISCLILYSCQLVSLVLSTNALHKPGEQSSTGMQPGRNYISFVFLRVQESNHVLHFDFYVLPSAVLFAARVVARLASAFPPAWPKAPPTCSKCCVCATFS